jgi:quinol monooxygenase YgiN
MSSVGRIVKATARTGRGAELAATLLDVAESLRDAPGCELYLISRSIADPDVIWIVEQWDSQELLDAALAHADKDTIKKVLGLVRDDDFERIDVEPLGGVG